MILMSTNTFPKIHPLSKDPSLIFEEVKVTLSPGETFTYEQTTARFIGRVEALTSLPAYQRTPMFYRICEVQTPTKRQIILGSRCGYLHSPHLNARTKQAEQLWCMNCWSDSLVNVPFYLYYRYFDTHVIDHLPPCRTCEKRFQVWDPDEPLKEGHTYLFSAFLHPELLKEVEKQLESNETATQG